MSACAGWRQKLTKNMDSMGRRPVGKRSSLGEVDDGDAGAAEADVLVVVGGDIGVDA